MRGGLGRGQCGRRHGHAWSSAAPRPPVARFARYQWGSRRDMVVVLDAPRRNVSPMHPRLTLVVGLTLLAGARTAHALQASQSGSPSTTTAWQVVPALPPDS